MTEFVYCDFCGTTTPVDPCRSRAQWETCTHRLQEKIGTKNIKAMAKKRQNQREDRQTRENRIKGKQTNEETAKRHLGEIDDPEFKDRVKTLTEVDQERRNQKSS